MYIRAGHRLWFLFQNNIQVLQRQRRVAKAPQLPASEFCGVRRRPLPMARPGDHIGERRLAAGSEPARQLIVQSELAERGQLIDTEETHRRRALQRFLNEVDTMLSEQIGLLFVAEPRKRAAIETDAFGWYGQISRFFVTKIGPELLRSCVLNHRRCTWLLWSTEAANRRELEHRVDLETEGIVGLLALHDGMRDTHRAITTAVDTRMRLREERRAAQLRLLRAERARGVFAACVADLQLAHDAARARVEWAEADGRQAILLHAGLA